MCWLGWIPPRREEGPALGVSTPQVCIRVVPGQRELLLLLIMIYLINRFAHSAGPGMVRHRAVWIGIGMDDLMRSSKGQEGTGR